MVYLEVANMQTNIVRINDEFKERGDETLNFKLVWSGRADLNCRPGRLTLSAA
jgi:hypothetical protein